MKKTLLFLLWAALVYADNSKYMIKLASYHNETNLKKQIARLEPSLQQHLILVKEENLTKLFTEPFKSKDEASYLLPLYRKVFADAYIMAYRVPKGIQKSATDPQQPSQPYTQGTENKQTSDRVTSLSKIVRPRQILPDSTKFDALLQNRTYYLCPDTIKSQEEKIMMEAKFEKNRVRFTTLVGKTPSFQNYYYIYKNRIYFSRTNHPNPTKYTTIDAIYFDYMVLARWLNGKVLHRMRYYYNREDARSYLDSIHL